MIRWCGGYCLQFRFMRPATLHFRLLAHGLFHTVPNDFGIAYFLFQLVILLTQAALLGGKLRDLLFPLPCGDGGVPIHHIFQILRGSFIQGQPGAVALVKVGLMFWLHLFVLPVKLPMFKVIVGLPNMLGQRFLAAVNLLQAIGYIAKLTVHIHYFIPQTRQIGNVINLQKRDGLRK